MFTIEEAQILPFQRIWTEEFIQGKVDDIKLRSRDWCIGQSDDDLRRLVEKVTQMGHSWGLEFYSSLSFLVDVEVRTGLLWEFSRTSEFKETLKLKETEQDRLRRLRVRLMEFLDKKSRR